MHYVKWKELNVQDLLEDFEKLEEVLVLLNKGRTVDAQVKLVKMAWAKQDEFKRLEAQMETDASSFDVEGWT